jgi:hypothetical protein
MQHQQQAASVSATSAKKSTASSCFKLALLLAPLVLAVALWIFDFYAEATFIDLANCAHPLTAPIVALMKLPADRRQPAAALSIVTPNPASTPQRDWITSPRLEMDDFAIAADLIILVIQIAASLVLAIIGVLHPWSALIKSATTQTTQNGRPFRPGRSAAAMLCVGLGLFAMLVLSNDALRDMKLTRQHQLRDFTGFLLASARQFVAIGFCLQLGVTMAVITILKARLGQRAVSIDA